MNSKRVSAGDEQVTAAAALARVIDDLSALQSDQLVQVTLNARAVASTILRVLPRLKALREQLETKAPGFDLLQFDKLEDYTWALLYADARFCSAILDVDDSPIASQPAVQPGRFEQRFEPASRGTLADAADLRLRALNVVLSTYEEARRAVRHIRRREGDADSLVPSLYSRSSRHPTLVSEHPTLTGIGTPLE